MPDDAQAPVAETDRVGLVRVLAVSRGHPEPFDAELAFDADALTLTPAQPDASTAPLAFRYADLNGATVGAAGLVLHLAAVGVAELSGDLATDGPAADLAAAAVELTRRACALPELTSHLRAFGSQRAHPGSEHDRFFAPFLAARRAAESRGSPVDQLEAFDARALRAATEQTLADFAADRFPATPPDRRALEAELVEFAEPMWQALDRLARAREAAYAGADEARFRRWREWAAAVRGAYAASDRVWVATLPALAVSGARDVRQPALWRRVLRRG